MSHTFAAKAFKNICQLVSLYAVAAISSTLCVCVCLSVCLCVCVLSCCMLLSHIFVFCLACSLHASQENRECERERGGQRECTGILIGVAIEGLVARGRDGKAGGNYAREFVRLMRLTQLR